MQITDVQMLRKHLHIFVLHRFCNFKCRTLSVQTDPKSMRNVTAIFLVVLFAACNKPVQTHSEINKVELARSGAWSDHGAAISVDSLLNYRYYDGNTKKFYVGRISPAFWDTLTQKFEKIKFKTLSTDTVMGVMDAEYFELIIYWKNGKKRTVKLASYSNSLIDQTFLWLNFSYKNVKFHQCDSLIKFGTTFQISAHLPSIDQIKFPPPIKKK